jgi:hypothetical protein
MFQWWKRQPTLVALWRLRVLSLFMLGPAAGIVLVDLIFGLPTALWWSAGTMSLLMLALFLILVLKERAQIVAEAIKQHKD